MTGELLVSFAATKALLGCIPGPAVMLVLSHGLERGRSRWAAAGIVVVNAAYFLLAATGLSAVLLASSGAIVPLKWAACGYFVYAGIRSMTARNVPATEESEVAPSAWRSLLAGIVLQIANPNALLFFVALLPTFVTPHQPLIPQIIVLGLTALSLDCLILAAYGTLAERLHDWAREPHVRLAASRIGGALLIVIAILTAFAR